MYKNHFKKTAAKRIAAVTITLASLVTPLAWNVAREKAENRLVSFSIEESKRLISHFNALSDPSALTASNNAKQAAEIITDGLFDIAYIYDKQRTQLAVAYSTIGKKVLRELPKHGIPKTINSTYQSDLINSDPSILRVSIPLYANSKQSAGLIGYFEGIRVISDWQKHDLRSEALGVALIACLASLLCGLAIYPMVVSLSVENEQKNLEVLDSQILMMEALGRAIANRDSNTGAHNYRVAWVATKIGEKLGLSGAEMQSLIAGSLLHDIGKVGIPDSILLKPGRLNDEEMATMRTHVTRGEEIVAGLGWLEGAHEVVAAHHEKWDGSGYPRKLSGLGIPLAARIFAVADVFDALSSKRPYKEPIPYPQVMEILRKESGAHFDPSVLSAFESVADEARTILEGSEEAAARFLLHQQISKYFYL